jgi:hypothetical protein
MIQMPSPVSQTPATPAETLEGNLGAANIKYSGYVILRLFLKYANGYISDPYYIEMSIGIGLGALVGPL